MLTAAFLALALQAPAALPLDYDAKKPANVQPVSAGDRAGVTVKRITYEQLDGSRNEATLVLPAGGGDASAAHPAILFVHWYEPPKVNSNRTEFLPEAIDLAAQGTVSLLIDTPWATEDWFAKRNSDQDYDFSIAEAKEIRRALDVLWQQARVDPARVAIVGHDFGAMYGALAAAADPRVTHLVYMAGNSNFSDWFLFTPKREGDARDAFVAKLKPLAPQAALARFSPRPVLLQFGTKDRFVTTDAAKAQADAVQGPKTVKMYDGAEHELRYEATRDRVAWLEEQFRLK